MKTQRQKHKYHSVLLIDDSMVDNFINEKMLEAASFSKNIFITTNGKVAIDYITNLTEGENQAYPEVIFIDLNMPVMNGFQFIENIKSITEKKLTGCKMVILTSSINHADKIKAEQIDPRIIFVHKPLTNEFLENL